MISLIIVLTSLVMAVVYTAVYLLSSNFREKVEQPKHIFMEQLDQYAPPRRLCDE